MNRPNFVFFFPDELRAESLACYGHPLVHTPHFDRLAAQGTRFAQCHVQHTVCTPSRCSLMTGWYPHVAGHRSLWHLLRPHEPSLFRYLKEAGYHIEWHGKNDLYAPEYLAEILDSQAPQTQAQLPDSARVALHSTPPTGPDLSFLELPTPDSAVLKDARSIEHALEFLRRRRPGDPPFMLFLPLGFPHPPYTAHESDYHRYDPATLPPLRPPNLPGKPSFHALIRHYRKLDRLDDAQFRRVQAVYLGMIGYVDRLLGRLLDTLAATGLDAHTHVIASSDHGDWAGDFGLVEKWPNAFDDPLTRVPLIVRGPDIMRGHVCAEPVELFDIMPTVLELAGLEPRHTHFARSFVPQLAGATGDPDRAVFIEGGYDLHEPHCFEAFHGHDGNRPAPPLEVYLVKGQQQAEHPASVCRSVAIRTSTHKLVLRTSGENEFYDLASDPHEQSNRWGDPAIASIRTELERRILRWQLTTSDVTPFDDNPRGFPPDRVYGHRPTPVTN